jgi:hypothetical protein
VCVYTNWQLAQLGCSKFAPAAGLQQLAYGTSRVHAAYPYCGQVQACYTTIFSSNALHCVYSTCMTTITRAGA